jgi:hypothetical protein
MGVDRGVRTWRWAAVCSTLLATATLQACNDSVIGPELQSRLLVEGITYRVASFDIAESFPVQVGVTVQIQNESGTSQSVTFPDGCVLLMRAYDARGSLVWDLGHLVGCTQALVQVALSPGESREVRTGLISATTILGENLPDGEYRIAVYLQPNGQTVELDAGAADLAIPRS